MVRKCAHRAPIATASDHAAQGPVILRQKPQRRGIAGLAANPGQAPAPHRPCEIERGQVIGCDFSRRYPVTVLSIRSVNFPSVRPEAVEACPERLLQAASRRVHALKVWSGICLESGAAVCPRPSTGSGRTGVVHTPRLPPCATSTGTKGRGRRERADGFLHCVIRCQTAFKRDPRSASKRDPLFG